MRQAIRKTEPFSIREELSDSQIGWERIEQAVYFMEAFSIPNIRAITDTDILRFREMIRSQIPEATMRRHLEPSLEMVRKWAFRDQAERLMEETQAFITKDHEYLRTMYYLAAHGIRNLEEIDYALREKYAFFLSNMSSSASTYAISVLDRIKLFASKRKYDSFPEACKKTRFLEEKVFLLYHPYYPAAKKMQKSCTKDQLVFDFSLPGRMKIKKQIHAILDHLMLTEDQYAPRMLRAAARALQCLYLSAIEEKWEDLEMLLIEEEEVLSGRLYERFKDYAKLIPDILKIARRFLFSQKEMPDFRETVWFFDQLPILDYRKNPSGVKKTLSFTQLHDPVNREALQEYDKYKIGFTDRALSTIIGQHGDILMYLKFCERCGLSYKEIGEKEFDAYIEELEQKNLTEESFNCEIRSISMFYDQIQRVDPSLSIRIHPRQYLKKVHVLHHDRSVPYAVQIECLRNLKHLPIMYRLMFLHLWALGLRAGEVCQIRAENYFQRGQEYYLRIYQNKMRSEKIIPIPEALYQLMDSYIHKKSIPPCAYVFSGKNGKPISYTHMSTVLKNWSRQYGIEKDGYTFRCHDFRHTVATKMHEEGKNISVIRDYLGHKESDMTKQYIDDIPEALLAKSEHYFKRKPLSWEETNER